MSAEPPAPRARESKQSSAPPEPRGSSPAPKRPSFRPSRAWILFALVLLGLNFYFSSRANQPPSRVRVPYSPFFLDQVRAGHVKHITSKGTAIQGTFTQKERYAKAKPTTRFRTEVPAFADNNALSRLLQSKGVIVNAQPLDTGAPWWQNLLLGFGPTILFVLLLFWLMRRAGNVQGMLGQFGRSRARRYQPSGDPVTFADVAGIDEAKEELTEVVDFLRHPEKYRRLGGRIPHGVLLSGPPGTGKTLLARAVAGEANVPFFSLSASEFIEMIVGVGASRVRDLFQQAKQTAPAIIFIDELDAIGRSRAGAVSIGGHDEREQTLNQILTEMDGFDGTEGVIVLAATNRPEILDPALLRPGRFDRRVTVNPPDQEGRRKILEVHTRHVPLGPDVDLDALASSTAGMVGADLKNLVNEAALLAARRGHDRVAQSDFTDALEKVLLGAARRITLSPEERERTAYHESGHALLGMLVPGADPVRKVSIVPRGQALGVTFQAPSNDRYGYDERYLRGRIVGALGGRASEEIVYGNVTTGAESDLDQVTRIARSMVGRWGMSDKVGLVSVLPPPGQEANPFVPDGNVAPATRELVDAEVRRIVEECYEQARAMVRDNRDKLEALAHAPLQEETLDEAEAYAAAGFERPPRDEDERKRAEHGPPIAVADDSHRVSPS